MVAVAIVPHGSHCVAQLHTLLCSVVCTDVAAHQRGGEGGVVDGAVRNGKDLSVRRFDDSRSRGLPATEEHGFA